MIDDERLSCPFTEMVHIQGEIVWRGIEIQDNATPGVNCRRAGVFARSITERGLLQPYRTQEMAIYREVAMKDRRLPNSDGEKLDDHRWNGVLLGMSACRRCGGLLTRDEEFSLSIERKMPSLRCIQCGEWLDEIILRNRLVSRRRETPNRQQTVRM